MICCHHAGASVAVIGDFAETPRYQGAGSSAVNSIKVDTFLDCLNDSGLYSVGFAPGFDRQGKPDDAKSRGRRAGEKGRHRAALPGTGRDQGRARAWTAPI